MRASATWAMISALPTCRSRPSRPVMQNWQPTAQPTCDDTQRPSRGSSTLSTVWPSASATSSRSEPSAPGCAATTRASPASSASMAGKASINGAGKKLAGRRLPLFLGRAWDHSRRMRCSWLGPAPAFRSRSFSSWIRMRPLGLEASRACRLPFLQQRRTHGRMVDKPRIVHGAGRLSPATAAPWPGGGCWRSWPSPQGTAPRAGPARRWCRE